MENNNGTDRNARFKAAVEANDEEYLSQHEAGRQLGFNGMQLDDEKDIPQPVQDGFDSAIQSMDALPESQTRNKVFAQPHPLGGIEVIVFGVDGTKTSARISESDAAVLQSVLQMWITTTMQQTFFQMQQQAAQATESGIVIPR